MLILENTTATEDVSSILINRQGALGDVLLITPFLPVLKSKYVKARIDIRTDAIEILSNNPYVYKVIPYDTEIDINTYDLVINLNLSYEKEPKGHIIDTYKKYFKIQPISERPQLFLAPEDYFFAESIFRDIGPFVVFDIGKTWSSRAWPLSHYAKLAALLKENLLKRYAHLLPELDLVKQIDSCFETALRLQFKSL